MSLSTAQVLAPKTILKAISQLDLPGTALQKLLGWGLSSRNVRRESGRNYAWDIFNNSRKIATARDKGQASSRQEAQGVGLQKGTFPRSAETIVLLDEDLLNRRGIGGPDSRLDHAGETYLTSQEVYLAQRFTNLIEFQTAAMFRGSYSFTNDGDELRHGFSGGEDTVDFKIPAGNKSQLNMLGAGNILNADWAITSTDIPRHLQNINTAMVQLTGMGLAHVVLTGTGWQYIVNNLKVQAQGGSSNVVFESLRRVGHGEFSAILRAIPWVTVDVRMRLQIFCFSVDSKELLKSESTHEKYRSLFIP